MQIGSIAPTQSTDSLLHPVLLPGATAAAKPTTTKPAASTPSASAPASSADPNSSAAPAKAAPERGGHGGKGGGGGGGQDAVSLLDQSTDYSTSVGGKQYSGSVESSNGQYTASIPNVPGATASGSSLQSAEANLDAIISVLV